MKKLTRVLAFLFVIAMTVFTCTFCGDDEESASIASESVTSESVVEKYSVTFANTSISTVTVEKGSQVSKPDDPAKSEYIFGGWFTDNTYSKEVQFPITVNADTTVYAKFFNYQEAFKEARNNTIGDTVPGFEYNYTLDVTASYTAITTFNLNGHTTGSAQYSNTGDVNFYDQHTNTGLLFYDGSKYQIRRGTTLQNVALDKYGKMDSYSVEEVSNDYKYDSSSFAKAVFTYSDDQLKSIAPTNQEDVYKLKTAMNTSSVMSLVGNNLNNPIVAGILGGLPETAIDSGMYVTFANGRVSSYKYEMKVNVSDIQFNLVYNLTFTSSGTAKTITPKDFSGIAITPEKIGTMQTEASSFVNAFKNKAQSGYDFKVKTGVDYGAKEGEINSTFKGSAFRKVDAGTVYFHNDIEIDSDYKNKDLYDYAGIKDIHVKETKLSNGEVHLIEKKILTDYTEQVKNFVPSAKTSYYLFDVLSNSGTYTFAEKTVKDGVTSYSFGLSNAGVATLLNWMNGQLNLDPFARATTRVNVFGQIDASSLLVDTGKLVINVKGGALDSIEVKIDCDAMTSLPNSRDFSASRKAQLKLDYTLTPDVEGNNFVPYDTVKKAQ